VLALCVTLLPFRDPFRGERVAEFEGKLFDGARPRNGGDTPVYQHYSDQLPLSEKDKSLSESVKTSDASTNDPITARPCSPQPDGRASP
jgi:hypothetical protein